MHEYRESVGQYHPLVAEVRKDPAIKGFAGLLASSRDAKIAAPRAVRSAVAAFVALNTGRPLVIITSHKEIALRFQEEIGALIGADQVKVVLPFEILPFEELTPNPEVVGSQLEAINRMKSGDFSVTVIPATAITQNVPKDLLPLEPIEVSAGLEIDRDLLIEKLTAMGYSREYVVDKRGQIAVRGDIVDIFSGNHDNPVRIEFFGDTIESIRIFNLGSQTSLGFLDQVRIFAVRGWQHTNLVRKKAGRLAGTMPGLASALEMIAAGSFFPGFESLWPLFGSPATLLDFINPGALVLIDDDSMISFQADKHEAGWREHVERRSPGSALSAANFVTAWKKIKQRIKQPIGNVVPAAQPSGIAAQAVKSRPFDNLFGRVQDLPATLSLIHAAGSRAAIAVESEGREARIAEILSDASIPYTRSDTGWHPGTVLLIRAAWLEGFWLPDAGVAIISENDIFRSARRYRRDRRASSGAPISAVFDLVPGDHVVHVDSGIGIFKGLMTQSFMGVTREYMVVEYAAGDKLYVPLEQLDRIQRYVGSGKAPEISRLGGKDWHRAKTRAANSAKKLAFDLMELYAARLQAKKMPYGVDTVWQTELEDSFPFAETPDQIIAIAETKSDLESPVPMDRLVCGDVGYGKTEVALRAAFKVVNDGRQVGMLVPTTILAEQHYQTFSERLAPFPARVALMSRFVSKADQRRILSEIAAGSIDIVIGTHRLLQSDVEFKDLGLVIIDEEQRFGVGHKEQIKNLRRDIDVLTLSATPIPRTLQMALSGVRDLSIINTPPADRLPVTTYVGSYSQELVVDAVRRELSREGQVFFVHNQIATIDTTAARLKELLPEAVLAVAHGQMPEQMLEKRMRSFLDKQADVLVSTTIIESGIDIPNANTLIVDKADRFGLAQLYQLRGRVGRAHQQAYAYFFVSDPRLMTKDAQKRLQTIAEFTELGAGFKIALQDLEIRGAGNILGAEQSGQIEAVGFELYSQLLAEEVSLLQGQPSPRTMDIHIDLPIDAFIPADFIAEEKVRVEVYRQMAMVKSLTEVEDIKQSMRDRFGLLPLPVQKLIDVAKLRMLAGQVGINKIAREGDKIRLRPIALKPQARKELKDRYMSMDLDFTPTTVLFNATDSELLPLVMALLGDIIRQARRGSADEKGDICQEV